MILDASLQAVAPQFEIRYPLTLTYACFCSAESMEGKAMSAFEFGTPEYWRERAEQARVRAESLNDPEAKREMLEVAVSYERIAARVDRTTQRSRKIR